MSIVATALAMTNHRDDCVRYIPGHFSVNDNHTARNLTQNNYLGPIRPVPTIQFQELNGRPWCVHAPRISEGGISQDLDKLAHLWTLPTGSRVPKRWRAKRIPITGDI